MWVGKFVGLGLIILCKRWEGKNIFGSCKAFESTLSRAPEKVLKTQEQICLHFVLQHPAGFSFALPSSHVFILYFSIQLASALHCLLHMSDGMKTRWPRDSDCTGCVFMQSNKTMWLHVCHEEWRYVITYTEWCEMAMLHKQDASEMWPPVSLLIKVAFGPCAVRTDTNSCGAVSRCGSFNSRRSML